MIEVADWLDFRTSSAKQIEFCHRVCSCRQGVGLYGGSGGSGKSYTLRTLAVYVLGLIRDAGYPGQRFMLSCSTYDLLRDRHIAKIATEFAGMGEYRESHKIHGRSFIFDDRSLGVIALRNLDDPGKYRGTECIGSGVDELTELPVSMAGEDTLSTLLYPIRSPLDVPILPFAAGSNPDGIGWQWVKQIWIDRDLEPFKLSEEQTIFVQALVHDNPHATPEMIANLQRLTGHLYESRYLGNWDAPQGARWPQLNRQVHQFKFKDRFPYGIPEGWRIVFGGDWGKRAPYCALWFVIDPNKDIFCFREDYQAELDTDVQAQRVKNLTGGNERISALRFDPSMWSATQSLKVSEPGPTLISFYEKELNGDPRFGSFEKGYKGSRFVALSTWDKVLSRGNGYPDLYIEEGCVNLWRELSAAIWDTRGILSGKREDLDPRCEDHAITAGYYALHAEIEPYASKELPELDPVLANRLRHQEIYDRSVASLTKRSTLFGRR